MSDSLHALERQRQQLLREFCELGDLRPGSITPTRGTCGTANCHCHRAGDPGHGPNLRLTYKVDGKTVTETFPTLAAQHKAEREVGEFRRFQQLSGSFVEVNSQICRQRPVAEAEPNEREKKRLKRSSGRSPRK
jgi:hypothetical protein